MVVAIGDGSCLILLPLQLDELRQPDDQAGDFLGLIIGSSC
jgi:hypothetical protein